MSSGAGQTHARTRRTWWLSGILIVISMGLLGWGIYVTGSRSEVSPAAKGVPSRRCAHPKAFGEVRVDLPAGCAVVEMRPTPIAFIFAPDPPDCASVSSCSTPPFRPGPRHVCAQAVIVGPLSCAGSRYRRRRRIRKNAAAR